MLLKHIAGVVLLVAGTAMILIGIDALLSVAGRWSSFFIGHFTGDTEFYIIAGVMLAFIGLALEILSLRRPCATEPS